MRVFDPDGDLMADEDTAGVRSEELELSIGPGQDYGVELRCWMGSTPDWRFNILVGL